MSESLYRHKVILLKFINQISEACERKFAYGDHLDHQTSFERGGYLGNGMRVETGSLAAHPCFELANRLGGGHHSLPPLASMYQGSELHLCCHI